MLLKSLRFYNRIGCCEFRFLSMMSVPSPLLDKVPNVEIDPEGRFKYVLIRVYAPATKDGNEPSKMVVRGNARGAYHDDLGGRGKCLEDLVKYNQGLLTEGPDVVLSVFRHKLSRVGRPDLADWLSRVYAHKVEIPNTSSCSPYESSEPKPFVEYRWTYMDFAVSTLATWAILALGWLVIQLVVVNMKVTALASQR